MLQALHKILVIILAFIMIFSSLSFTVEKHICMDEVTDVSYFDNAESCGMEEDVCNKTDDRSTNSFNDDCCDMVHEYVPGNPIVQEAVNTFEMPSVQFIVAFTHTFALQAKEIEPVVNFTQSSPPLEKPDLQVLYQHFLI